MKRYLAVIVGITCASISCNSRTDRDLIQGEWQVRAMFGWFEFYLHPVKGGPGVITFTDDTFTYTNSRDPGQSISGTFSCDESKNPREVTFSFGDKTIKGIYSVSGRNLDICVGESDSMPPRSFTGGPKERPALLNLARK